MEKVESIKSWDQRIIEDADKQAKLKIHDLNLNDVMQEKAINHVVILLNDSDFIENAKKEWETRIASSNDAEDTENQLARGFAIRIIEEVKKEIEKFKQAV